MKIEIDLQEETAKMNIDSGVNLVANDATIQKFFRIWSGKR